MPDLSLSAAGLLPAVAPVPAAELGAAALRGLLLCLSLIVAIGAQNAFVLRQGLRREHVGTLVLLCSLGDALLMAAGVAGLASLVAAHPGLARGMAAAGALFLLGYGAMALRRALQPGRLDVTTGAALPLRAAVLQLAGFTLLNPHVYLDTVLLVGSVGAQYPGAPAQAAFVAGAATGSALWFTALGYGARWLAPVFARPRAWQVLDAAVGLMMLALAAQLLPMAWPTATA